MSEQSPNMDKPQPESSPLEDQPSASSVPEASGSTGSEEQASISTGDAMFSSRFGWFLAEFAIVVSGVLVALALNAWWQAQEDRSHERLYLEQLSQDVTRSISDIETVSRVERPSDRALTMLVRAFRMQPRPSQDSLLVWSLTAPNMRMPTPVLGTARTLVTSGDLQLIRSDTLRLALPTYVESQSQLAEAMRQFGNQFLEESRDMLDYIDYLGLVQRTLPPSFVDSVAQANDMFALPPNGVQRLIVGEGGDPLQSAALYGVLSSMHTAQRNMVGLRQGMLVSHQQIERLLQEAME